MRCRLETALGVSPPVEAVGMGHVGAGGAVRQGRRECACEVALQAEPVCTGAFVG